MKLSVDVVGIETLRRDLEVCKRVADDLAPLGPRVAKWVREKVEQNIFTQGRSGGKSFAELKPSSEDSKYRAGYGFSNILVRTRQMRDALTQEGAADSFQRFTPTEIVVGAVGEAGAKASRHQSGTKNMVARKPMQFTDADFRNLMPIVRKEVATIIRKRTTFIQTDAGDIAA